MTYLLIFWLWKALDAKLLKPGQLQEYPWKLWGMTVQIRVGHAVAKIVFRWFSFFGSSLAHLEPELQLFEVNDIGDDGDNDLSYHYLPNFKRL